MKAINCTQCGAVIQNVSEVSLIITCDYCSARILLSEPEQKQKPLMNVEPPRLRIDPPKKISPASLALVAGVALLLPLLFAFFAFSDRGAKSSKSDAQSEYAAPYPDPTVLPIWSSAANTAPKPVPIVNYQPRVSWDGPNDIEHFDEPQVDIATVSHMTSEEVKNTVFKNRTVKLRVVINTEGEIDNVETISGHPILVEAATASAKRSIFRSRSKPTTRVLVYTFRVLKD